MTTNDPIGEKGQGASRGLWRSVCVKLIAVLRMCGLWRADTQAKQDESGCHSRKVIDVGRKWWVGSALRTERLHARQAVGLVVLATAAVVVSVGYLVAFERSFASAVTTMETGANESKTLILPDGTKVWLGAESRLWADFRGALRRIYLQGRATVDVAPNVKPFMLATYLADATTMDGKFSAVMGEADLKLTVHRGTVSLSTKQGAPVVTLKEGQRFKFIAEPPRTAQADANAGREKGATEG